MEDQPCVMLPRTDMPGRVVHSGGKQLIQAAGGSAGASGHQPR
jgi:hypothetical protein